MLIYVNWEAVLRNQPIDSVFANLCSGDPEYLRGIFNLGRYEEYFTKNQPKIPELGILLKQLSRAHDVKQEFNDFLKEYPVPYFIREFEGYYDGTCSGIPSWSDEKNKRFYQTFKIVGSQIQYRNIDWMVLYSRMIDDRAIKPHIRYIFIMIPYSVFQLQPTYPSCFDFEGEFSETTK